MNIVDKLGLRRLKTCKEHPVSKIPSFAPVGESQVRCKKCNHRHHHRHGYYFRKATHRRLKAIQVLRCRCLSCRGTFCVLPQDFLPVMRWTLTSVRHASRLLGHMSAYSTAQTLCVSLGVYPSDKRILNFLCVGVEFRKTFVFLQSRSHCIPQPRHA
jgi:hypothetical protein